MTTDKPEPKPPYRGLDDYSTEELSERAWAIIRAASLLNERDHGVHLGMPRLSGVRDNGSGHYPCMWCILGSGTSTWDISTDDLNALSDALVKEMTEAHRAAREDRESA